MESMKHPHIVTMHAYFIDSEISESKLEDIGEIKKVEKWFLCIVMEHASKGDLLHFIEKHKENREPIEERVIWTVCS